MPPEKLINTADVEKLVAMGPEKGKYVLIVTHCANGVRAEMTYHKLKEKGYQVKFLNAKIEIDKDGNYKIEKI